MNAENSKNFEFSRPIHPNSESSEQFLKQDTFSPILIVCPLKISSNFVSDGFTTNFLANDKAKFTQVSTFFPEHIFLPWEFLLKKKLKIATTKTTFVILVLKVVY